MDSAQSRAKTLALSKPYLARPPGGRIDAIDFARGVAVALMILNHGVKGLLDFADFPDFGLVPVHMVTRFASSLFIMVFGVALAVAFLPKVQSADWPRRRRKLLLTAVIIYFWYKVLTVAEMLPMTPEQTLDALLYRSFPSFVEILGFYAIALLWIPFFLTLWCRMPLLLRLGMPVLVGLLAFVLLEYFHFWNNDILQALLVEHEDHYTWGQLSRAPLVFIGLLIGELILRYHHDPVARKKLAGLAGFLALTGGILLIAFVAASGSNLSDEMRAIAFNEGKHPPETMFMLFSMGGALVILAIALLGGERLASLLRPITIIGSNALQAFIFHIAVIFVVFRYLLGYWQAISYQHALVLTLCLILATALWIKLLDWIRRYT